MRKILWLLIGVGAALAAAIVADIQSIALLNGGTGLHVAGIQIDGNIKDGLYYASRALFAVSMVVLGIALVVYTFKFLGGKLNYDTDSAQIVFLLLALVVCSATFGAVYRPYNEYGWNPINWYQSPQWWILSLMIAPVVFLVINLVCGLFWSNTDPLQVQLASIRALISESETRTANAINGVSGQVKSVGEQVKLNAQNLQTHRDNLGNWQKHLEGRLDTVSGAANEMKAIATKLAGPPQPVSTSAEAKKVA